MLTDVAMNLSYFETFHELGSNDQIDEEYGSMSLTSSIETWCDHQKWIFEDVRGEVLSLLTDFAATTHVGPQSNASSRILLRFNDEEVFSAIVYYFKLLASKFLKADCVSEQDSIPDGLRIGNFCKDILEPLNTEIENPGVTILIDILVNPMSIAVEIVYVDRSGTHVKSRLIRA
jgi:ubiquitin thioesterase protein OTUB1